MVTKLAEDASTTEVNVDSLSAQRMLLELNFRAECEILMLRAFDLCSYFVDLNLGRVELGDKKYASSVK